jgi:hypothetical protein
MGFIVTSDFSIVKEEYSKSEGDIGSKIRVGGRTISRVLGGCDGRVLAQLSGSSPVSAILGATGV